MRKKLFNPLTSHVIITQNAITHCKSSPLFFNFASASNAINLIQLHIQTREFHNGLLSLLHFILLTCKHWHHLVKHESLHDNCDTSVQFIRLIVNWKVWLKGNKPYIPWGHLNWSKLVCVVIFVKEFAGYTQRSTVDIILRRSKNFTIFKIIFSFVFVIIFLLRTCFALTYFTTSHCLLSQFFVFFLIFCTSLSFFVLSPDYSVFSPILSLNFFHFSFPFFHFCIFLFWFDLIFHSLHISFYYINFSCASSIFQAFEWKLSYSERDFGISKMRFWWVASDDLVFGCESQKIVTMNANDDPSHDTASSHKLNHFKHSRPFQLSAEIQSINDFKPKTSQIVRNKYKNSN